MFCIWHIVLADQVTCFRINRYRIKIFARNRGRNMTAGMSRRCFLGSFQFSCDFPQLFQSFIRIDIILQFRIQFPGLIQSHFRIFWNKSGNFWSYTRRITCNSSDIPDNSFCVHGSKSLDLWEVIFPIVFSFKSNNFILVTVVVIYVDIRHRYSFRIKESFKQKIIWNRVNVGNSETITHPAAGSGTASGTDQDSMRSSPHDGLSCVNKILSKSHLLNHTQFIFQVFSGSFTFHMA